MIGYCAAYVMGDQPNADAEQVLESMDKILTLEPSLHQIDMRGDANGSVIFLLQLEEIVERELMICIYSCGGIYRFFTSGFLISSLHHLITWTTAIPVWHPSGSGDPRSVILNLATSAKLIGGTNFARRYIMDEGKMLISLGYAVVLYREVLDEEKLSKSVRFPALFSSG